mmetsp:Transcript_43256/g.124878  ORF Transcript_43256/g.124878 Transcript_43256/m.124878 type:complete len:507 (+) Transcript_43256:853-2373(+)
MATARRNSLKSRKVLELRPGSTIFQHTALRAFRQAETIQPLAGPCVTRAERMKPTGLEGISSFCACKSSKAALCCAIFWSKLSWYSRFTSSGSSCHRRSASFATSPACASAPKDLLISSLCDRRNTPYAPPVGLFSCLCLCDACRPRPFFAPRFLGTPPRATKSAMARSYSAFISATLDSYEAFSSAGMAFQRSPHALATALTCEVPISAAIAWRPSVYHRKKAVDGLFGCCSFGSWTAGSSVLALCRRCCGCCGCLRFCGLAPAAAACCPSAVAQASGGPPAAAGMCTVIRSPSAKPRVPAVTVGSSFSSTSARVSHSPSSEGSCLNFAYVASSRCNGWSQRMRKTWGSCTPSALPTSRRTSVGGASSAAAVTGGCSWAGGAATSASSMASFMGVDLGSSSIGSWASAASSAAGGADASATSSATGADTCPTAGEAWSCDRCASSNGGSAGCSAGGSVTAACPAAGVARSCDCCASASGSAAAASTASSAAGSAVTCPAGGEASG